MQNHSNHLLTEITAAIADGFVHHFHFSPIGLIHLSGTNRTYDEWEIMPESFKQCLHCGWTLFRILTNDGLKGTAVHYHDDFLFS